MKNTPAIRKKPFFLAEFEEKGIVGFLVIVVPVFAFSAINLVEKILLGYLLYDLLSRDKHLFASQN